MRAGLLKEILVFEAPIGKKTQTGFVSKEYEEVFRCKAQRKKQSIIVGEENAKEIFIGQMAMFLVRRYPQINYSCRVRWAGCVWDIKMIEPNGKEFTLTLKKIDI